MHTSHMSASASPHPHTTYDNITSQGESRVQMGHVYNTYHAPVHQGLGTTMAAQQATETGAEMLEDILRLLQFDDMDERQMMISTAHADTCKWFFEREEYKLWRDRKSWDEHSGFLWVKGHPGAGKSVLMRSAVDHGMREHQEDVIISFFFNARGDLLQRSAEGMYRSLIHQLLTKTPDLLSTLSENDRRVWKRSWRLERLKGMFRDLVLHLGATSLTCYVDALDECEDEEAQDVIEFLEVLSARAVERQVAFHALVSSRHFPHVMIRNCIELVLENEEEHMNDIKQYIEAKLRIGNSSNALDIKRVMQRRSSGIFLWVVLVVQILNKAKARGDVRSLRSRLVALPFNLHELFDEILGKKFTDESEKKVLLLTFQWLLYTERPLRREELYFALAMSQEEGLIDDWDPCEVTKEDMELFILQSSRGLAELTKAKRPVVQFIHESVRDYLRDTGLRSLYPHLDKDMHSSCHQTLRDCCHDYLIRSAPKLLPSSSTARLNYCCGVQPAYFNPDSHPFLSYALRGSLFHANAASSDHLPQHEYVHKFDHLLWARLYNLVTLDHDRRLSKDVSPAYIFTIEGVCNLLETLSRETNSDPAWDRDIPQAYYPSLLDAAVSLSHHRIIDLLIERGSSIDSAKKHTKYLSRAIQKGDLKLVQSFVSAGCAVAMGNGDFMSESGSLVEAVKSRDLYIVECLLTHEVYTKPWHADFTRALHWASFTKWGGGTEGYDAIQEVFLVKLKLAEDEWNRDSANMERVMLIDLVGALVSACKSGRGKLVGILLQRLQMETVEEIFWDDALQGACANGHSNIGRVLLECGAGVNGSVGTWNVPLIRAARNGHLDTVRTLLDHGADLTISDGAGYTAIHFAAANGHDRIVALLLERGADPYARSWADEDAMVMAVKSGHATVLKVFLESKSTDRDRITASIKASRQRCDSAMRSTTIRGSPRSGTPAAQSSLEAASEMSGPSDNGIFHGRAATAFAKVSSDRSVTQRKVLRESHIAALRAIKKTNDRYKAV